jgi:hypothetical protein
MVCDDKWHSVVRVVFFILDEVFSVNTTCFVKTMVNARIVVTPLFSDDISVPQAVFWWFRNFAGKKARKAYFSK